MEIQDKILFLGGMCCIIGSTGLIGIHIYEGINTLEQILTNVFIFGITLLGADAAYTSTRMNN